MAAPLKPSPRASLYRPAPLLHAGILCLAACGGGGGVSGTDAGPGDASGDGGQLPARVFPALYFADGGTLYRLDLATGQPAVLASQLTGLAEIALDPAARSAYWTRPGAGLIQRAQLDGTGGVQDFWSELPSVQALAVDPQGGWVYWSRPGLITRARSDQSDSQEIFPTSPAGEAAATLLLGPDDTLYWSTSEGLWRGKRDGSANEHLDPARRSQSLVLGEGVLYSADHGGGLNRLQLDGSGAQEVVPPAAAPARSLSFDPGVRTLYWLSPARMSSPAAIRATALEPVAVQDVRSPLAQPSGLALGP